jgi:hypothetical protein
MAEKAKAIGTIMQQEDGLARAIKLIEGVIAKHEVSAKKLV